MDTLVPGESFFHSFPRDRRLRTIERSLQLLRSILEIGLLLVPEIVLYPPELRDEGDEKDSIVNVQRRFSLTMLPIEKLRDHQQLFGSVTIEFSSLAARRLGAIPVIYLPQASSYSPGVGLDQLGYFLSYRIAELQQICDEIMNLREKIGRHRPGDLLKIRDVRGRAEIEITRQTADVLLDIIVGQNDIEANAAALQGISSLFYPTDEFRHSVELVRSPLYYYFQREWRILSNLVLEGGAVDTPLTEGEKQRICACNPEFFNEIISLRHSKTRRIDACTVIRSLDGKPIRELIQSISVAEDWRLSTQKLLDEFSMGESLRRL